MRISSNKLCQRGWKPGTVIFFGLGTAGPVPAGAILIRDTRSRRLSSLVLTCPFNITDAESSKAAFSAAIGSLAGGGDNNTVTLPHVLDQFGKKRQRPVTKPDYGHIYIDGDRGSRSNRRDCRKGSAAGGSEAVPCRSKLSLRLWSWANEIDAWVLVAHLPVLSPPLLVINGPSSCPDPAGALQKYGIGVQMHSRLEFKGSRLNRFCSTGQRTGQQTEGI